MNQQEFRAASGIGLLYLVRMLGLFMVLPVLPVLALDISGATPFLIGLAIGIYGLSQAALQIPLGLLSDRIGRKQVIGLGLGLFIAGSLIAGFAENIHVLILGRFMQGCGAIASSLLALLSDLTRVDQRAKAMALVGIAIAGSFGLSLILGPLISSYIGLSGIFFLTAALGLLGLVILLLFIATPQVRSINLDTKVQKNLIGVVIGNQGLWRLNLSIFVSHYLLVSLFMVLPVLFLNTGRIEFADHSLYYLALLGISFIGMLPFMWLSDRLTDVRVLLVLVVSLALIACWIMGSFAGYWWVLFAALLFFIAFNLLEVVLPAQVSRQSEAGARGTAMGVYTTCQFFGIFAGGALGGWILSFSDYNTLLSVNVGLIVVWLCVCLSFPSTSPNAARTIPLGEMSYLDANQRVEALLSLDGVIDAVIIEEEQVAYLKVDESVFIEESVSKWARPEESTK